MKLNDPQTAYTYFWNELTGNKLTASHAAQMLDKHFRSRMSQKPT